MSAKKFKKNLIGLANKYSKQTICALVAVVVLSLAGFAAYYYFITRSANVVSESSAVYTDPTAEEVASAQSTTLARGQVTAIAADTITIATGQGNLAVTVTADSQITTGDNYTVVPLTSLAVGQAVTVVYQADTNKLVNINWEVK